MPQEEFHSRKSQRGCSAGGMTSQGHQLYHENGVISGAMLTGYLFGKGVSLDDSPHLAQKEIPGISLRQALKWKGKKELGDSFCKGEMGKAILSHTQKQEAIRENEPTGEEEGLSKVKGVCVCVRQSEVMHVA